MNKIPSQNLGFLLTSFSLFLRFAIVGLSGVFIDLFAFYLLHNSCKLELIPSSMLSTQIGIINNFIWNDIWTFNNKIPEEISNKKRFQRFIKFNLICLVGLIINSLIVNFLFSKFAINEYIAKLVAIGCVTLWNFWLNLMLNWKVAAT